MNSLKINWSEFIFYKGSSKLIFPLVVCLIFSSVLGGVMPHQIKNLAANYDNDAQYFNYIYILLGIFIGIYINRVTYQLLTNLYIKNLIKDVRTNSYSKWINNMDLTQMGKENKAYFPQGEVMARLINDTESLRDLITSGSFAIVIDLFFIISSLISFLMINMVSGLVIGAFEILAIFVLFIGSRFIRKLFLRARQARGRLARGTSNIVGGLTEIYFTNHGKYASKKGNFYFVDFLKKQMHSVFWDANYFSLAESLYPIFLILLILIFPYSSITTAAVIFAVIDLIQRSMQPIKDLTGKIASIQRAFSGIIRINEFNLALDDGGSGEVEGIKDFEFEKIEVDIPHFEYPKNIIEKEGEREKFAIKNIKFSATKGNMIGIVGGSGSGKSTLLNIIAGNNVPKQAMIKVYGKNNLSFAFPGSIKEIATYKREVGIVSQESHIFSESLVFNTSLNEVVTPEFDQFWKWINEQIPYLKKWDIKPTEKIDPSILSEGQKQLLAGIRSCYLKKTIILFDEISSGLDSELEEALRKVLLLVQKNSLTFIVAHRVETVIKSDLIFVMADGEIISSGGHDELLKTSNIYKHLLSELGHKSTTLT